jgi:hypothetical protein
MAKEALSFVDRVICDEAGALTSVIPIRFSAADAGPLL